MVEVVGRSAPQVSLVRDGQDRDCAMIAQGWDTLVEAYNGVFLAGVEAILSEGKEEAALLPGGDGKVLIELGGDRFEISGRGAKGGVQYWLTSVDGFYTVLLRSPKMGWCISVRYNSIGLWQQGHAALKERVRSFLFRCFKFSGSAEADWNRVTEAHFATDLYSPSFSEEMTVDLLKQIVCHQETKQIVNMSIPVEAFNRGGRMETLTIGNKSSLQIQVYDKGKEITEVSGKDWMMEIWQKNGWLPDELSKPTDCWRVEVRLGKEFLRARGIITFVELMDVLPELLCEALQSRRLAERSDVDQVRHVPMHWFWATVIDLCGSVVEWVGLGRRITESGSYLRDIMKKSAAGTVRAAVVLQLGCFEWPVFRDFLADMIRLIDNDPNHDQKCEELQDRYRNIACSISQ